MRHVRGSDERNGKGKGKGWKEKLEERGRRGEDVEWGWREKGEGRREGMIKGERKKDERGGKTEGLGDERCGG